MKTKPATIRTSKRDIDYYTDGFAYSFYLKLCGDGVKIPMAAGESLYGEIWQLCRDSFRLYSLRCGVDTIENWSYPDEQLECEIPFDGNDPCAVLLRRAFDLVLAKRILGR